jgi:hypothetical protein
MHIALRQRLGVTPAEKTPSTGFARDNFIFHLVLSSRVAGPAQKACIIRFDQYLTGRFTYSHSKSMFHTVGSVSGDKPFLLCSDADTASASWHIDRRIFLSLEAREGMREAHDRKAKGATAVEKESPTSSNENKPTYTKRLRTNMIGMIFGTLCDAFLFFDCAGRPPGRRPTDNNRQTDRQTVFIKVFNKHYSFRHL